MLIESLQWRPLKMPFSMFGFCLVQEARWLRLDAGVGCTASVCIHAAMSRGINGFVVEIEVTEQLESARPTDNGRFRACPMRTPNGGMVCPVLCGPARRTRVLVRAHVDLGQFMRGSEPSKKSWNSQVQPRSIFGHSAHTRWCMKRDTRMLRLTLLVTNAARVHAVLTSALLLVGDTERAPTFTVGSFEISMLENLRSEPSNICKLPYYQCVVRAKRYAWLCCMPTHLSV